MKCNYKGPDISKIVKVKRSIKKFLNALGLEIHIIKEYEKNKFTWLKDFKIETVIDIGANEGQFAVEISKYLSDAYVYSFEPLTDVYDILLEKCKILKRFKAYNIALGNFNGNEKIYKNEFSPSSSLLDMADLHKEVFPFTSEYEKEEVTVKRLDDFANEENISLEPNILIKIDVQGYEDKVIEGGKETISKAKVVICEVEYLELYKGQPLFDDIYSQLKSLGFFYKGSLNNFYHPKTGLPLFADAIFLKRSETINWENKESH
jgi:FkbM family methyltransferase